MTINTTTCAALTQADVDFADYVREAVEVVVGSVVEPLPGSSATAVALFEVIHFRRVVPDAVGVINRVSAVTGLVLDVELSARVYATPSTVAKAVVVPAPTP